MIHVYKGSVGVEVVINTRNDLTGSASCDILVQLPDGTTTIWTPTSIDKTLTTNAIVYYTTETGDLEQAGNYTLQLKTYQIDGDIFYSDAFIWKIYDTFEVP